MNNASEGLAKRTLDVGWSPGRLAQMSWVAGPAHLPQGVPGGQGPDVKGKPERCYSLIYINLIIS